MPEGHTVSSATASAINKSTGADATGVILFSPTCTIDAVEERALCIVTGGVLGVDYAVTIVLTMAPFGTLSDTITVAVRNC